LESLKLYITKFRVALLIIVATIAIVTILVMQIVPQVEEVVKLQRQTKDKIAATADLERKLENYKLDAANKEKKDDSIKAFFKPITGSSDTETAITEEFEEILQLMRDNKVKARSVKYEADPADDNFVKSASAKYQVCRITAELIANYKDFERFLRDLYKHEHFLEISKFEILPYKRNKRILLINLQIKLYAERDSVVDSFDVPVQSTSQDSNANNANNANNNTNANTNTATPSASKPASSNDNNTSDYF